MCIVFIFMKALTYLFTFWFSIFDYEFLQIAIESVHIFIKDNDAGPLKIKSGPAQHDFNR